MNRIIKNLFAMQKGTVATLCIVCTLFFALAGCNADLSPFNEDNSNEPELTPAQEFKYDSLYYFYNHEGEKEFLSLNTEYAFLSVKEQQLPEDIQQRGVKTNELLSDRAELREYNKKKAIQRFFTEIHFTEKLSDEQYLNMLLDIKQNNRDAIISPYFKNRSNEKIGLSNFFFMKSKSLCKVK